MGVAKSVYKRVQFRRGKKRYTFLVAEPELKRLRAEAAQLKCSVDSVLYAMTSNPNCEERQLYFA